MSGVLSYITGDKFLFRVFKSLGDPASYAWSNTYEVVARSPGDLSVLKTLGGLLVMFEEQFHGTHVTFDRWSVGTWELEGAPYNPDSFYIENLSNAVGRRTVNDPVGNELCWWASRNAASGRAGKLFYRGCLGEADVEREGANWVFTDPEAMAGIMEGAVTSTSLGFYLAGGLGSLGISLIGPINESTLQVYVRDVTTIVSRSPLTVDVKHPWYNQPGRTAKALARKAARVTS